MVVQVKHTSFTINAKTPGTNNTLKNVEPTTDPKPMSSFTKNTPEMFLKMAGLKMPLDLQCRLGC